MDFLKYLDILIEFAVVMVLLSPVVTALTQLCMWVANNRSAFLLEGLKNLLLQIDGNPAAIIEIKTLAGARGHDRGAVAGRGGGRPAGLARGGYPAKCRT